MLELRSLLLLHLAVEVTLHYKALGFVRNDFLVRLDFLHQVVVIYVQDFHVIILVLRALRF